MSERGAKGPIAWMASHGVAPNILMLVFIVGGLFMTTQIKQEVFPSFTPDTVTVMVPFPGASPEEVEEGVILAIEEEVRAVRQGFFSASSGPSGVSWWLASRAAFCRLGTREVLAIATFGNPLIY